MKDFATAEEILKLLTACYPECLHIAELQYVLGKEVSTNVLRGLAENQLLQHVQKKFGELPEKQRDFIQARYKSKKGPRSKLGLWRATEQALTERNLKANGIRLEDSFYGQIMQNTSRMALQLLREGRTVKGIVAGLAGPQLTTGKEEAIKEVYKLFEALLGVQVLDFQEQGFEIEEAKITVIRNPEALAYLKLMAFAGSWAERAMQGDFQIPAPHYTALYNHLLNKNLANVSELMRKQLLPVFKKK